MAPSQFATPQDSREGEIALEFDPAQVPGDASAIFIGSIASSWQSRETCPKNMRQASEAGVPARVIIDPPYRPGLAGLERATHIILLTWFDRSPRNLIVQKPRHSGRARGVFALRSPVRPNPVGIHVVRMLSLDLEQGIATIDAIDVLDGTPLLDIKPYLPSIDAFPDAQMAGE